MGWQEHFRGYMAMQRPWKAKIILRKNSHLEGLHLELWRTVLKLYWLGQCSTGARTDKQTNERDNRAQKYTYTFMKIWFTMKSNYAAPGKDGIFSELYWMSWLSTCQQINLDSYLIPYPKFTSKLEWRLTWK